MSELARKKCIPCSGGVPRLTADEVQDLRRQVPDWDVILGHHLRRVFAFDDFAGALVFVNRIGEVAEAEGHHPNITFTWGRVEVEIWTHKIDGLAEADFILAAKVDQLPRD
ncbi:MAG: 4a-hydroxytetrahydrobiopterin dehydratase [Candidatus Krumholzibacteriia bacterium]